VKTVSDKVVKHSLANYPCKLIGGRPLLCENLVDDDPPVRDAPIFDI